MKQAFGLRVVLSEKVIAVHLVGMSTPKVASTQASDAYFKNVHSQASRYLHRRCELSYSSGAFKQHGYRYIERKSFGH
jgi:hypothetical protein